MTKSTIKTIGIIGGGQLGRMTCFAAHSLGFKTVVFADHKNSPASFVTNQTVEASYENKSALQEFARKVDVVTFEFENIPFASVDFIDKIIPVYPRPEILKTTQNRLSEKRFCNSLGIKTAEFAEISGIEELKDNLKKFGKAILKTATMGYDGKGQFVMKDGDELESVWNQVKNQQLILEKFCPFESEISVIVARSVGGEITTYEPLSNIHKNGILDQSIYPARISTALKNQAQEMAKKIALELGLVGVLAIEFFVMKTAAGEELFVNEMAPRPHNSGHFSMDASVTSQFEQLIRAITDLPLGSTKFHSQGYMQNLIGSDVENLAEFYQNSSAKIHLYGKLEAKAGRKMGHVNILEIK